MELYLSQAEVKAISKKESLEKILKEIQNESLLTGLPKAEVSTAYSKMVEAIAWEFLETSLKAKIKELLPKAKDKRKKKVDIVVEFEEKEPPQEPQLSKALEDQFDAIVAAVQKDKLENKIETSAKKRVLIF